MDSHHGPKRNRDDCLVAERQTAYSLNRLTAVINELSRLIDSRPSSMIERMLADPMMLPSTPVPSSRPCTSSAYGAPNISGSPPRSTPLPAPFI